MVFKKNKDHDTSSLFMYIRMLVLVHWLLLILIKSSVFQNACVGTLVIVDFDKVICFFLPV